MGLISRVSSRTYRLKMLADHFGGHDSIHWLDATVKYEKNNNEVTQMFKEFFKQNSDSYDCLIIGVEQRQQIVEENFVGSKPTNNVKFSSIKFGLGTLENIDSARKVISIFKKGMIPIYKPEKELHNYQARHHNPILDKVNCKFTLEEYIKVRYQKNQAMIKMKSDPVVESKPAKKVKSEPKNSENKKEKIKSEPKPEKKTKNEKKIKSEVKDKPKSKPKQS